MKSALILHGTNATTNDNWFPWLKEKLEAKGYQIWLPQLPGADKPNIARYNQFLLANKDFKFNEDTTIIGHSSGAVAALGLLQALPVGTKVGNCYLVSAFTHDLGWESLVDLFDPPLDYAKIKNKAKKLIFIHGDEDPYCPLAETKALAADLEGEMKVVPGAKHFSISTDGPTYQKFPFLLELLEKKKQQEVI